MRVLNDRLPFEFILASRICLDSVFAAKTILHYFTYGVIKLGGKSNEFLSTFLLHIVVDYDYISSSFCPDVRISLWPSMDMGSWFVPMGHPIIKWQCSDIKRTSQSGPDPCIQEFRFCTTAKSSHYGVLVRERRCQSSAKTRSIYFMLDRRLGYLSSRTTSYPRTERNFQGPSRTVRSPCSSASRRTERIESERSTTSTCPYLSSVELWAQAQNNTGGRELCGTEAADTQGTCTTRGASLLEKHPSEGSLIVGRITRLFFASSARRRTRPISIGSHGNSSSSPLLSSTLSGSGTSQTAEVMHSVSES